VVALAVAAAAQSKAAAFDDRGGDAFELEVCVESRGRHLWNATATAWGRCRARRALACYH
jgi:hypothetical protein